MLPLAEYSADKLLQRQDLILDLEDKLGKDISYVFRDPKADQEILIRADIRQMMHNAHHGTRENIVKVSYADRKEEDTTTAQLVHCLGPMLMKTIQKGDSIELYIQTEHPIVEITSMLSDNIVQAFLDEKGKFDHERFVADYNVDDLRMLFAHQAGEQFTGTIDTLSDKNGIFIWPDIQALRALKQIDSIRADRHLNSPLATHYQALMINPGSYILPIYHKKDDTIKPQLAVHAAGAIGG